MFTAVTGQEAVDLRKMDPSRRLWISLAQERKIPEQGRINPEQAQASRRPDLEKMLTRQFRLATAVRFFGA